MVPQPGTRDRQSGAAARRLIRVVGRMVGFCVLAGTSLAILAAVLLLPEYARLERTRYELAGWQAATADKEARIAANERLKAALPDDRVLTKRLAISQHGLWPENEVVVATAAPTRRLPPGLVAPAPHPRPDPPSGWLMKVSERVSRPPLRRGLLLMAAVAMLAALFLFGPRHERDEQQPNSRNDRC